MKENLVFIIVGFISIVLSIVCFFSVKDDLPDSYRFGADFYTESQNSAAATARNVYYLEKIAAKGFGSILLVTGLILVAVGLPEEEKFTTIDKTVAQNKVEESNTENKAE